MRKTILGIALLIIIFSCILVNNAVLDKVLSKVINDTRYAQEFNENGNREEAVQRISAVQDYWLSMEIYFFSYMNHDDVENVYSSIQELKFALIDGQKGNFESVYQHVEDLLEMEKISIKSIL